MYYYFSQKSTRTHLIFNLAKVQKITQRSYSENNRCEMMNGIASWTKKAKVPSEGQEMTGAASSAGKIEFLLRPMARASSAIEPVSVKDMPITVGGITMVSVEKMGIKILLFSVLH